MISKSLLALIFSISLFVFPSLSSGQESQELGEKTLVIRYLYSFDAVLSEVPYATINDIFIDNRYGEVYAIDSGNKRIVITDLSGAFLYQFSYVAAKINNPRRIVVSEDGTIYILDEPARIVVLDYAGNYLKDMGLSTLPPADKVAFQAIGIEGDYLYVGDSQNQRLIVMDRKKEKFVKEIKAEFSSNLYFALDTDGIYIMDPRGFMVHHLDRDGKPLGSFGKVSGLAGGFSMMVDIAVDRKNGRVMVLDTNRIAVIVFDRNGNFIIEFGGPQVFRWPRVLAVDDDGRIYVADGSYKVRVFDIIEDVIPPTDEP